MLLNKKTEPKISERIKAGYILKQNFFETKKHGAYVIQIVMLDRELYFVKQKTETSVDDHGNISSEWKIVEIMNLSNEVKRHSASMFPKTSIQ